MVVLKLASSLANTALVRIAVGILLLTTAYTVIIFVLVRDDYEQNQLDNLSTYMTERIQRESMIFNDIRELHAQARTELAARLKGMENTNPENEFEFLFPLQPDKSRRSRPQLFDGTYLKNGDYFYGIGAFIADGEALTVEDKRLLLAAFYLVRDFGEASMHLMPNFYFFTPNNRLVIFAPNRPDRLLYYRRDAPADFDFSGEELNLITLPENNPERITRCTSLQPIVYDTTKQTWTTGCQTPVDINGVHVGSFGTSILLSKLLSTSINDHLEGTQNMIISTDGFLIAHPTLTKYGEDTKRQLNLMDPGYADLKNIWKALQTADFSQGVQIIRDQGNGNIFAAGRIEVPGWYFVTAYPRKLINEKALDIALNVMKITIFSALLLLVLLYIALKRNITNPLQHFVRHVNRIATGEFQEEPDHETHLLIQRQDEIGLLAHSIQSMAQKLAGYFATLEEEVKQRTVELDGHRNHLEELVEERTERLARALEQEKASASALQASEAFRKHAAKAVKFGYWHFDELKNEYTSVSDEYAQIHGYTAEEFMERYKGKQEDFELVHPQDKAKIREIYKQEDDAILEFQIIHRDGGVRHVRESLTTVYDDAGTFIATHGTLQDITDDKLAEIKLRKALRAADKASQAKSTFLANMSHEIRTPLNAIVGFTHLLQQTGATPEQMERLHKIDVSCEHLLAVINDVLDLSKIEAGKLTLARSDFHLDAVFTHVLPMFKEQIEYKGLSIEIIQCDEQSWVRGDLTRLRQALFNYLANAIKFTERGIISLRARKLDENDDGFLIRFEVQDTGIGIEPDKLKELFKAFEQVDASATRKHGGTGLGLTITQRLARLMGGEAGAESKPGQGSIFWFTAQLERGCGALSQKEDTSARGLLAHHRGVRVLLVEDNAINREVAVALLGSVDLVVDTAESGREAVDMVRTTDYGLVLMDIQMPEMDGLEATCLIRAMAGQKDLPILAMTANAFEKDRQACLKAGMNDFVAKPINVNDFFATLARWLRDQPDPTA